VAAAGALKRSASASDMQITRFAAMACGTDDSGLPTVFPSTYDDIVEYRVRIVCGDTATVPLLFYR
jgi:hypothetical protein